MLRLLTILIVGTLGVSAFLCPFVYSLLEMLLGPQPFPFSRVYDRVAMVVLLGLVLYFRSDFSIHSVLGYFRGQGFRAKFRQLLAGMALSLGLAVCGLFLMVQTGQLNWGAPSAGRFVFKLTEAVAAGILISLIEESFFRVLLFQRLRRVMSVFLAALVSSVVYSLVHFVSPDKTFVYEKFSPLAGFEYLLAVAARLIEPGAHLPFLGLLLVGLTLCYTIYKTNSLILCIGLHSGWVIGLKLAKLITQLPAGVVLTSGMSKRYFLVAQPIGWLSIAAVFVVIFICVKAAERVRVKRMINGDGNERQPISICQHE